MGLDDFCPSSLLLGYLSSGLEQRGDYNDAMVKGLRRVYGGGDWHFITCSCYRRQPFLGSAKRRDLFLEVLEEVRARYEFDIAGYVVMPEHFHLLITEPKHGTPPLVMQLLKQRVSRACEKRNANQGNWAFGMRKNRLRFGNGATTISMCIPSANTLRNCATCIGTPSGGDS